MTLTLWRGDRLLGELRPRPSPRGALERDRDKPPSLAAILLRAPDAPAFDCVWQIHPPIPGMGVQQHAVEPDIVAERYQHAARHTANSGPFALHPMSPEQAAGVAAELQLTVHDEAGRVFRPLMLRLQESRHEPKHYGEVLREAPAEAMVDGVVWTVLVVFASEAEAPTG